MDSMMLMQLLVPESRQLLQVRFRVLQAISFLQPIGRRGLAKHLQLSERVLRSETDLLKNQGLIHYSTLGMSVTELGKETFEALTQLANQFVGLSDLERQVALALDVPYCKVISPRDGASLAEGFGHEVQRLLNFLLPLGESIVAVTGGRTMAMIAEYFTPELIRNRQLSFVPARGGVGGATMIQANSVSEQMALRTGGEHYSLYVPEHVSPETYQPLMQEPLVAQTIAMMKQAQGLLYSVGSAMVMAERRGLSSSEVQLLIERQAVGEAFGCFFNAEGKVVFKLPRVGLHLSDLEKIPHSITIVEGPQKAEALRAYAKLAPVDRTWFVIDESLATMVLNGETR